jgi:hypothetical protein
MAELENWVGGILAILGSVALQLAAQFILLGVFARRSGRRAPEAAAHDGAGEAGRRRVGRGTLRDAWQLSLTTISVLITNHLGQVLIWALLFTSLSEFGGMSDAIYFSLASYTTVGAADLELTRPHRVLGALEAGLGVLMFGWSGAILVVLVGLTEVDRERRG